VRKEVSFTSEEWHDAERLYRVMRQSRGYKDFSEFARKMLTQGKVMQVVVAADPDRLHGDMNRIGSNINQIAHQANTSGTVTNEMLEQVLAEQKKIIALFQKLNDDYDRSVG
jgi:hypothetical protein